VDDDRNASVAAVAALAEPTRRRLYDHVARQAHPVSRDDAAAALDLPRATAAFHLDRLVTDGLLDVHYERRTGRTGPGAGRPAKLYRRASGEVAASLPPRTYETAAHLLAEAVEQTGADLELQAAARRAGQEAGRREVTAAGEPGIEPVLAARGYEPYHDGPSLRLRNCPFANLAGEYPVLVCAMNLSLIEGLLEGSGEPAGRAGMDPGPDRCCVAVRDRPKATSKGNQD
jgi:predicted ArsR family transcriptional regulator